MGITLRTFIFQILPVVVTFLLLAVSLTLINQSTNSPAPSGTINRWLVPLNITTLIILFVLIMVNLVRALLRLRTKETGSRYTLRLMTAFALLTVLPVLVVSYFSMNFIGDRIDSWYDVQIERSLGDSLELAQRALKTGMSLHLRDVQLAGSELVSIDSSEYARLLDKHRRELNAYEMILLDSNRRVIAFSGLQVLNEGHLFDHFPAENIFTTLDHRGVYLELELDSNGDMYSRVAIKFKKDAFSEPLTLTALFPVSPKFNVLSESVQEAHNEYQARKFQRTSIKHGFRLSLFIIMVLSVLFALWAAFIYSMRLTSPIRKLLDGTLAVASGDLQKKLPVSSKDDFSLLARSFNTMTTRLSDAQRESERSRLQVQRQHDYLNIVLNHLTSGVITLDESLTVRRINAAALQLLELKGNQLTGKKITALGDYSQTMADFIEATLTLLQGEAAEWKTEILTTSDNKRRIFHCEGVSLPELMNGEKGVVLVFDDMTDIVQAEHDAAWAEVARRLAHEIKNPLTPIQLSAERLQHRLLPELSEPSADLLKRMTQTITQQVEAMKAMVNAFSEYARTPALQFQNTDLNWLIRDVAELYRANEQQAVIRLDLQDLPMVSVDVHRLRQVFINLIKNALEAMESVESPKEITISSRKIENDEVCIRLADNGPGVSPELLPELFEPYISNKVKGTGLGLAIVKKIIEEHSGRISVRNAETTGAIFTILLPVTTVSKTEETA